MIMCSIHQDNTDTRTYTKYLGGMAVSLTEHTRFSPLQSVCTCLYVCVFRFQSLNTLRNGMLFLWGYKDNYTNNFVVKLDGTTCVTRAMCPWQPPPPRITSQCCDSEWMRLTSKTKWILLNYFLGSYCEKMCPLLTNHKRVTSYDKYKWSKKLMNISTVDHNNIEYTCIINVEYVLLSL
jgi:hypothetical protein